MNLQIALINWEPSVSIFFIFNSFCPWEISQIQSIIYKPYSKETILPQVQR